MGIIIFNWAIVMIGLSGETLIVTQFILQTFVLEWVGKGTFMIVSWMDMEALVQVVHCKSRSHH
jgi:hypothetical protein